MSSETPKYIHDAKPSKPKPFFQKSKRNRPRSVGVGVRCKKCGKGMIWLQQKVGTVYRVISIEPWSFDGSAHYIRGVHRVHPCFYRDIPKVEITETSV